MLKADISLNILQNNETSEADGGNVYGASSGHLKHDTIPHSSFILSFARQLDLRWCCCSVQCFSGFFFFLKYVTSINYPAA